jgi:hypothetical protein
MIDSKPVRFPLSDGTFAKITHGALRGLKYQRDVTSGRMKKGAGGNEAVYVTVEMHGDKDTVELSLRDVLAVFHYGIEVEHASQKFFLKDGDPRNLMPDNIGLTPRKDAPFVVERAPRKSQKPEPRPEGAMTTDRQVELLLEMNENREFHIKSAEDGIPGSERHRNATEHNVLVAIGLKLGGGDRLPLIREIVQELVVDLYGQIDRGVYTGIAGARGAEEQRTHFCMWVKKAATTQFNARIFGKGDVERQPIVAKLQNEFLIERDRQGRRVSPYPGADAQLSSPPSKFLNRERKAAGIDLMDVPQKFPAKRKKAA